MKKYYAYFIYNDEEYVIRFKIKGSLKRGRLFGFIDKDGYTRTEADIICLAAFNDNLFNIQANEPFLAFHACFLTHDQFVDYRSKGVKRWKPKNEIIFWD